MITEDQYKQAKPILFNTEMVRAILEGRKTVTRRVVKFPEGQTGRLPDNGFVGKEPYLFYPGGIKNSPYKTGDIFYVRETWSDEPQYWYLYKANCPYVWASDDTAFDGTVTLNANEIKWRPSIHMPKEAARIFLRVTDVRVERLQDITEEQAIKEGVPESAPFDKLYCPKCGGEGLIGMFHPITLGYIEVDCTDCETITKRFMTAWNSTIPKKNLLLNCWDANPWVWVNEFKRL